MEHHPKKRVDKHVNGKLLTHNKHISLSLKIKMNKIHNKHRHTYPLNMSCICIVYLPANISSNWSSVVGVYNLSRNVCNRMHKKREQIYEELDKVK